MLVDGIDNISGSYKYSLPDYVNSVDVTYTDGTVVKYTYDEASVHIQQMLLPNIQYILLQSRIRTTGHQVIILYILILMAKANL